MATTMEQRRAWRGPAVLSYGFRPFFFGAGLLSALLILAWTPIFLGLLRAPSALGPLNWHIHELLFGYVPAVIAGFLLTAVPNWTGRLPVVGWPLAGLSGLWIMGRVAVLAGALFTPPALAALTLAFPLALAGVIARELIAGRNWRNLKVLAALGVLTLAQAAFHYEVAVTGRAEFSSRLGIAAAITLIGIVAGRIVPSFTRNWIKKANPGPEPAELGRFDVAAMVLAGVALALWCAAPALPRLGLPIALVLLSAGAVHAVRLARWVPHRTLAEPLVTVLHVAYAFVPLGFALAAGEVLWDDPAWRQAAVHAWTAGAIGLMTLAVMTRATRGHSGKALTAPLGTVLIYVAVTVSALARVALAFLPGWTMWLLPLSGLLWVLGFAGFCALYAPMLLGRRQ